MSQFQHLPQWPPWSSSLEHISTAMRTDGNVSENLQRPDATAEAANARTTQPTRSARHASVLSNACSGCRQHAAATNDGSFLSCPIFRGGHYSFDTDGSCPDVDVGRRHACSWESCSTTTTSSLEGEAHAAPTAEIVELGGGDGVNNSGVDATVPMAIVLATCVELDQHKPAKGDVADMEHERERPPPRVRFSPDVESLGGTTATARTAVGGCMAADFKRRGAETAVPATSNAAAATVDDGQQRGQATPGTNADAHFQPCRGNSTGSLATTSSPPAGAGGGRVAEATLPSTTPFSIGIASTSPVPPVLAAQEGGVYVSTEGERLVPYRNGVHTSWRRRPATDDTPPPATRSFAATVNGDGTAGAHRCSTTPKRTAMVSADELTPKRTAMVRADELIALSPTSTREHHHRRQQQAQQQQQEQQPLRLFLRRDRNRPALTPRQTNSLVALSSAVASKGNGARRVRAVARRANFDGGKTATPMVCVGAYPSAGINSDRGWQPGGGAGAKAKEKGDWGWEGRGAVAIPPANTRSGRVASAVATDERQSATHQQPCLALSGRSSSRSPGTTNNNVEKGTRPAAAPFSAPAIRENLARVARASKVGTKLDPVTLYRQRQELERARKVNTAASNRSRRGRDDTGRGECQYGRAGGSMWGTGGVGGARPSLLTGWR